MSLTRRNIILGSATTTLLAGAALPSLFLSSSPAATSRVRYSATSSQGKAMLRLYAKGVAEMKSGTSAGTSRDWTFQWYTHAVRADTNKLSELDRIFPNPSDPNRLLASLVWDTCQSHFQSGTQPNFLPWHRAYLLMFEQIVREACRDDSFTLPYWDYTGDDVLPGEFRQKHDPLFGALYVENRNGGANAGANAGERVSQIQDQFRPRLFDLSAMNETSYLPGQGGVPQGFNDRLDFNLHGLVHVKTGDERNMGRVPFAARDPIFWLHHCNIDRIWAGWNAADSNRRNPEDPAWLDATHVFADALGNRRDITNREVSDIAALGYSYDAIPNPPTPITGPAVAKPDGDPDVLAQSSGPLMLGGTQQSITLDRPGTASATPLSKQAAPGRRRYLILEGVTADEQPSTIYHVVGNRPGRRPDNILYIGSIHFFEATGKVARFVFDLTEKLPGIGSIDPLTYTLIPAGNPAAGSNPRIGTVRLVEK